jgi:hypothetical protein
MALSAVVLTFREAVLAFSEAALTFSQTKFVVAWRALAQNHKGILARKSQVGASKKSAGGVEDKHRNGISAITQVLG